MSQAFRELHEKLRKGCQSELLQARNNLFYWSYYAGMGEMSWSEVEERHVGDIKAMIEEGSLYEDGKTTFPVYLDDGVRTVTFKKWSLKG